MITERLSQLSRGSLRLFDRVGQKMFPQAQALGADRAFSRSLPVAGPALRFSEITRVKLPNRLEMAGLESDGKTNDPPAGSGPAPAPDPKETVKAMAIGQAIINGLRWVSRTPSRIASASVRVLKAVFVGSVGGKVSVFRTIAKGLGLASLATVVPCMALTGPAGALSLVVTGPVAGLFYLAGRSKKAAPPAEPRKKLSFWRVENKIPSRTRSLLYAAYGLNLFATGLTTSARELFVRVSVPAAGLLVLGLHLLTRQAVKKALLVKKDATPEPKAKGAAPTV